MGKVEKIETQKNARVVLGASIFFNLTIQVLYVWSLLRREMMIPEYYDGVYLGGWGWTSQQAQFPYTITIVMFAIGALIGGRVQDRIGPRWVATVGGAMVGLGMIISGLVGDSHIGIIMGYGVVTGLGIGFGYGSVLPASLKWFHAGKKGLIGGLVLGGFGLASVHYAFITAGLLERLGIERTMLYIGIAVVVLSVIAAQFVKNPSSEFVPAPPKKEKQATAKKPAVNVNWNEMLKTRRFYMMFILFVFTCTMGLMFIGSMATIAYLQAGIADAAILISVVAVMNALGRIIAGQTSDRIGRNNTLYIIIILQMLNLIGFMFYNNVVLITFGFIMVGLCFGGFMALFPALTADQYGLKNYGVNYGIVYLAFGVGGVAAPQIEAFFFDRHGDFFITYIICAAITACMIGLNFLLKRDIDKAQKQSETTESEASV